MSGKKFDKNRIWEFLRQCPLISLIILTVIGFTIVTLVGAADGEYHLKISRNHTIFMSAMLKENAFLSKYDAEPTPEDSDSSDDATTATTSDAQSTPSDAEADDMQTDIPTEYATVPMRTARSAYYTDNDRVALTTNYPYTQVDSSYFNNAAFIGDSRIEGLHDYGSLQRNSTADFYYKDGISIWNLMSETMACGTTVPEGLTEKQYQKIYIMCGVNELGSGFAKDYQEQYKAVLDQIRQLQPNAVIFVIGIMHVTQSYSDASDVYNNDNIDCRNALVAEYANGQHIFYLDMNPSVCDMDGELPAGVKEEYSNDGIHLLAQYYTLWEDFLLQHGLSDAMFR